MLFSGDEEHEPVPTGRGEGVMPLRRADILPVLREVQLCDDHARRLLPELREEREASPPRQTVWGLQRAGMLGE